MQRLFKFIAFIFLVPLVVLLSVGLFSDYESEFSALITIESPKNISWKKMVDYSAYPKWLFPKSNVTSMKAVPLQRNSVLAVYPPAGNQKISTEYRITEFVPEKKIACRNVGTNQLPLLNDHVITLELHALRDGSSEITWCESYHVTTFVSKIYDKLIYMHSRNRKLVDGLRQLKRLIENY
jgi:uncharacterized membrane protein